MDDRRGGAPSAIVPELPRGANGIPEAFVEDDMIDNTLATTTSDWRRTMDTRDDTSSSRSHGVSDTVLSWFAFGALVIGVVGAITGAMSSTRRRARSWRIPGDPYELTPPHGDKLHLHY